ncbi:hypothetical protein [Paenibacillus tundrae]|uniref:Uncharacterized protein n=1 Tax=Paenibacillus tundrae TaxID=528187 RepID=A0ABT9WFL3_9BACL|nr:hypothetical protein [Paenibacillus tundrae]MDQ0171935.1 hypothetical protein [Paenibacillus tundrae]
MILTNDDIEKLLPWFGYGKFHEAEIVFFGNEEGLGGYPIEAVPARCKVYGNDKNTWIDKDWRNGYWDETSHEGYLKLGEKVNELLKEKGSPPVNPKLQSPFLDFQARMILYFENNNQDWFNNMSSLNQEQQRKIRNLTKHLFSDQTTLKAGLVDWRPLPRSNESCWPHVGIEEKKYLSAFKLNQFYLKQVNEVRNGKIQVQDLDQYAMMLWKRTELIEKVVSKFPFSILIGVGDIPSKKRVLEYIFATYDLKFIRKTLSNGKPYEIAELILPDKKVTMILTPFFNHRSNCLQLEGLKILCEDILYPMIMNSRGLRNEHRSIHA